MTDSISDSEDFSTISNIDFSEDIEKILVSAQNMLANRTERLTDGDVILFFANIMANLICNAEVCPTCTMEILEEVLNTAAENDLLNMEHKHATPIKVTH